MTHLEEHMKAREALLIVEARSAAGSAASSVASMHVSDLSARLGRLEERAGSSKEAGRGVRQRLP